MLNSILTSISVNLTICESVLLVSFAVIVWFGRKDKPYLLVFYGVFLILYITLLRREPGYNENIRLYLETMAGCRCMGWKSFECGFVYSFWMGRPKMETKPKNKHW